MEFKEVVKNRYSCKKFSARQVEGEKLAAADEGVDSCWVNFLDPEKLAEALGLPENEEVLMVMDLGYAAEGTGPLPNHTNRKRLEQTVSFM